jgi:putative flavoprotein involved in K+ transport
MESIETVIIGAGQAGLATSYHLSQIGREHLVLERAPRIASTWRNERWDSFTLVTPNWSLRLPGADYDGPDPDGFMPRNEVVTYLDQYVERFRLPVRINTNVTSVEPSAGGGYRVVTPERTFAAKNVVVATGFYQQPKIPPVAANLARGITQLHSSQYRNPAMLPEGAVLVVGSGQSGCQIAEELNQSGRRVLLSVGGAGRAPRRYRGRDIIAWLDELGIFNLTPEQLPPGMSKFGGIPHFSGTHGGHRLNLHQFASDGITLLGHLRGAKAGTISLAPDLHESLARADAFEREILDGIDGYVQQHNLAAPAEELPQPQDGFAQPIIEELNLKEAGVSTVIWAVGYTHDYSMVKLPVRDADGFPIQTRGVTQFPGLAFAGMPWMPTERSGFLLGVGEATRHIAATIAGARAPADAIPLAAAGH